MISQQERRRDVSLTTLIDLLVQVVFVFTLLLVASGAIEGAPEERGFVTPEVWKTLVNIFDVDVRKSSTEQAKEIQNRYTAVRSDLDKAIQDWDKVKRVQDERQRTIQEQDKLKGVRDQLQRTIQEQDKRIAELEKRIGGAPGHPPCRASNGVEQVVLRASIDVVGRVTTVWLPDAKQLSDLGVSLPDSVNAISRQEFQSAFASIMDHGLSRQPKCKYVATVQYDPRAPAGDYQPALTSIQAIFRLNRSPSRLAQ